MVRSRAYGGTGSVLARVLYDAMAIEWEDRPGRAAAARRNFNFDAPHGLHCNG